MFHKFLILVVIASLILSGAQTGQASASPETNVLTYYASIDSPVIYGSRNINVSITVTNNTPDFQVYDLSIWIGGNGWSGETRPQTVSGGAIYNMKGDQNGLTFYWRGSLEPGQRSVFSLLTFSGPFVGTFDFLKVKVGDTVIDSQQINIVKGEGEYKGYITFNSYQPNDEYVQMEIWTYGPTITQFQGSGFTSTCGILGLPEGFTGNYNRTIEVHTYFVKVPKHLGCKITGSVKSLWTGDIFVVEYYIKPPFSVFLPTISR